ncbi:hypothetical protein J3E74DRAFT_418838 [Bipolaris maydis]|nr:hypothetical protein J3E74DRAFT_418838 [Bipolaris maydis]
MKKSPLRTTVFLSLLGVSYAQTSSWGEPFTVEVSAPAAASTSALIPSIASPSAAPTSTWGDPFTISNSPIATLPPTSDSVSTSITVETPTFVTSSTVVSSTVVSTTLVVSSESRTTSAPSRTSTTETSSSSASPTNLSETSQPTGAAAAHGRGYCKWTFTGAVVGAQNDNSSDILVYVDSSLPNHTIYFPSDIPIADSSKFPVFIWGNSACNIDGTSNQVFLKHVAANGFLAISEGIMAPDNVPHDGVLSMQGPSNDKTMKQAIDWIYKHARKGRYANVDASRIMAAGISCDGLEAAFNLPDKRVAIVGILSSGLYYNDTFHLASTWKKPILFVMGGRTDQVTPNAEHDFKNIPAGTPKWKGILPLGHLGDISQPNGGMFGKATLNWALLNPKGSGDAAQYFKSGWQADGWDVASADLNKLKTVGRHWNLSS